MLPAHDDRLLRTCIHAKTAIDASHHVDIEPFWKLLDLRIRVFARLDIDTFRRTDGRAHVAGDAFQTSVAPNGENMCASEAFGIRPGLFGIINRRRIAFEQTLEQMSQRYRKGAK